MEYTLQKHDEYSSNEVEQASVLDSNGKEVFKLCIEKVTRLGEIVEYRLIIENENYEYKNEGLTNNPLIRSNYNTAYIRDTLVSFYLIDEEDTLK